jgi:3-deoxy-D-manno-octulosonic-acid transferase
MAATVRRLLGDREERERLGATARQFVTEQQGATERTLSLLQPLMPRRVRRAS